MFSISNPLRPRHLWPITQYHYSHAIFRDCHAYSITFNCSLSLLKHLNGHIPAISQFPPGIISKWFSICGPFLTNGIQHFITSTSTLTQYSDIGYLNFFVLSFWSDTSFYNKWYWQVNSTLMLICFVAMFLT